MSNGPVYGQKPRKTTTKEHVLAVVDAIKRETKNIVQNVSTATQRLYALAKSSGGKWLDNMTSGQVSGLITSIDETLKKGPKRVLTSSDEREKDAGLKPKL